MVVLASKGTLVTGKIVQVHKTYTKQQLLIQEESRFSAPFLSGLYKYLPHRNKTLYSKVVSKISTFYTSAG